MMQMIISYLRTSKCQQHTVIVFLVSIGHHNLIFALKRCLNSSNGQGMQIPFCAGSVSGVSDSVDKATIMEPLNRGVLNVRAQHYCTDTSRAINCCVDDFFSDKD
jgi:hypothetical protein